MNNADTAFMIISSILVMLMTPALALFYGGMVRKKNVLGTIMQSFVALGVVSVIWFLYGYSLAFGGDIANLTGNLDFVMLKNVGLTPSSNTSTIPHQLFFIFQMMFACLTPALITGAFAERFKFKSYLLFLILWVTFIYCPLAHWVWGGGWISKIGGLDFAGGLVVHIASGAAALACCIILGARKGYKTENMPPHNLTLTFIGLMFLWAGWFGFNAGSALSAGKLATTAFINTQLGATSGLLAWIGVEYLHRGKVTVLGGMSGTLAGLVGITPACGFVLPVSAIIIGIVTGMICYVITTFKGLFKYDDSLDVIGIHGTGGIVGSILTGVFATVLINPDGANGLLYGGFKLFSAQIISTISCIIFAFVGTLFVLYIVEKISGLRVSEFEEMQGLDISQHGENAYRLQI
ncbi:MAG: ammonium transporter [Candidatus Gastranaerophilales bacterium]|nr:ammonium transporter [Candidatus Gastranaerophilales bacterium]